jgi:hypothetical protein
MDRPSVVAFERSRDLKLWKFFKTKYRVYHKVGDKLPMAQFKPFYSPSWIDFAYIDSANKCLLPIPKNRRDLVKRSGKTTIPIDFNALPKEQEAKCAVCDSLGPTPIRNDKMGGYVCLKCVDRELSRLQMMVEFLWLSF